ncbi:MAG: hypothetical protein OER12_06885 [Acidimicrobiia bacterium]|nr:hypothetical protein [Acidimicrobiia bacterium]
MSLQRWAFEAMHIPGSLHFDTPELLLEALDLDDEIIAYCSDPACVFVLPGTGRCRVPERPPPRRWVE